MPLPARCVVLGGPVHAQPYFFHRHLVFIVNIDGADARVIGINGSRDAVLQEGLERMGSVIGHSGGLHVAGEVGFDADLMFGQILHENRIRQGMHGMPDAIRF